MLKSMFVEGYEAIIYSKNRPQTSMTFCQHFESLKKLYHFINKILLIHFLKKVFLYILILKHWKINNSCLLKLQQIANPNCMLVFTYQRVILYLSRS